MDFLPDRDLANATVANKYWYDLGERTVWQDRVRNMYTSSYMMRDVPRYTPVEFDGVRSFRGAKLRKRPLRCFFAEEPDPGDSTKKQVKVVLHNKPLHQSYLAKPAFKRRPCVCHRIWRHPKLCASFTCPNSEDKIEEIKGKFLTRRNEVRLKVAKFNLEFAAKCGLEEDEKSKEGGE